MYQINKGENMDYNNIKIPNHVAIIVDGNGRWAKERNLKRSKGHDEGYKNLKKLGKYIFSKNIKILSVYLFSTENFKRDKEEVNHLMNLFLNMFKNDINFFIKNNIKIIISGKNDNLSPKIIKAKDEMVEKTKTNSGGILNICFNYGGRNEIIDATKKIIEDKVPKEEITEELFQKYLYQDLPDVDLLIRTSGELRLSNFLPWQLSYAEFYFPKTYFPDFHENDFDQAILEYTKRDRRFGGIKNN